jgi:outer membrane murein-binding lipoprotein Lpp
MKFASLAKSAQTSSKVHELNSERERIKAQLDHAQAERVRIK